MQRILIVDDMFIIADGLAELMKEHFGKELEVSKAYSAPEALDILGSFSADIILTDIKMPAMSGIDLLKKVHALYPYCKVIFLTSYNQFDYALEAIKNGAFDYLLKTDGDEKILSSVRRAIDQNHAERQQRERDADSQLQLSRAQLILKREYMLKLLDGYETAQEENLKECAAEFTLQESVYLAIPRLFPSIKQTSATEEACLLSTIDNMIDDTFRPHFFLYSIEHRSCRKVWFLQPKRNSEDDFAVREAVTSFAQSVIQQANAQLGVKISCTFYRCGPFWQEISAAFSALCDAASQSGSQSCEIITTKGKENSSLLQKASGSAGSGQDAEKCPDLSRLLEENNMDAFLSEYHFLRKIAQTTNSKEIQSDIFHYVAHVLLSYIQYHNMKQTINDQFPLSFIYTFDPNKPWQFYDDQFQNLIDRLIALPKLEIQRYVDVVSQVQYYIDLHLNDELSLVLLSDMVHLNPSYLSRSFKQATGRGMLDYILERRVEKAKILLLYKGIKINEIASLVGYNSSAAFGRFFKTNTGITPQEYRLLM